MCVFAMLQLQAEVWRLFGVHIMDRLAAYFTPARCDLIMAQLKEDKEVNRQLLRYYGAATLIGLIQFLNLN